MNSGRVLLLLVLVIFCTSSLFAQVTYTSVSSGAWTTAARWSTSPSTPGTIPGNATTDIVIINGHDVTLNTDRTIASLTITSNGAGTAGRLELNANNTDLIVNSSITLNGVAAGRGEITDDGGNRTVTLNGNLHVPTGMYGRIGAVDFTQVSTGTFTIDGTFVPSSTNGTKILGDVIINSGGTWSGQSTETYGVDNFTIYDGGLIDGNSTSVLNVNGNLAVQTGTAGSHSKIGRVSMTVTGTTTVNGYLEFANSASGTKRFNGKITVNQGGTWDNIIGEDPFINCDIENHGLWPVPTGGTGVYESDDGASHTITGTTEIGMTQIFADDASTITNLGIVRLTGNQGLRVDDGGDFINGNGGYLYLSMATNPVNVGGGGSTISFTTANNTVEYDYLGDQNVYGTTYRTLVCSNGGIKETDDADLVINTEFRLEDDTIFEQEDNDDITGTANLVMQGTSVYRIQEAGTLPQLTGTSHSLASGTTIEYYGGTAGGGGNAQTAASSASYPYANILVTSDTNLNMSLVSNVSGNLTLEDDAVITNNAVLTIGGAFNFDSDGNTTLSNNMTTGSAVFTNNGTFTYSGRTITIDGTNGVWRNDGGAFTTNATSRVAFTTGTGQKIQGTSSTTFQDLQVNNTNGVTLDDVDATIASDLLLTTGRIITGNSIVIVSSTGSVTRTSGFVEGNLRKTFPTGANTRTYEIGTNSDYTPVSITLNGVTTSNPLTVSAAAGDHPEIASGLIEPNKTVNRYWSMTNNGIVFSAFSTGQVSATFNYVAADKDASLTTVAIPKWYNNSTFAWAGYDQFDQTAEQNPAMTASVNTTANTATFAVMNPTVLTSGVKIDFQIGEKIDPTYFYNRVTGTVNWSAPSTWVQQRTGVITLSSGNATITGASTLFTSELAVNDVIMLLTTPGTTYTVTTINNDGSIVVNPAPSVNTSGGYGRQRVPNSTTDFVVIGNTSLNTATTITLDQNATVLSLTIGSSSASITTNQQLVNQATVRTLTIGANLTIEQAISGTTVAHGWSLGTGSASVAGDISLGGTATTSTTRTSFITITSGTLTARNIRFRTNASGAANIDGQARLDMSTAAGGVAATLNLSGNMTFVNGRGRLLQNTATGSTINFNGTTTQTITYPSTGTNTWTLHHVNFSNSSTDGVTIGYAMTATDLTGNFNVQSGKVQTAYAITGNGTRTFQLGSGATYEMTSTTDNTGEFPTGFGTYTLNAASTTIFNQDANTIDISSTPTYGNLSVLNNRGATARAYTLANGTVNVAGNLVIGDGTNSTTLDGGGTNSKLNVTGNVSIGTAGTLDLSANFSAAADGISVYGNWTNDGTFTTDGNPAVTARFVKTGASAVQTIGGTSTTSFYNLVVNTGSTTGTVQMLGNVTVTGVLTLTQGGLDLNGNTLYINNGTPATTNISRAGTSYIKSENTSAPYGTLKWRVNTATGSFVFPFGLSSTEYIPFTFNVTSAGNAGTGDGTVSLSTYATAVDNTPYPTSVTNLNGTSGGASVADRYWIITAETPENFSTTRPTATLTFSGKDIEKPSVSITTLVAQRWSEAGYWDTALPSQTYNDAPSIGAAFWTVSLPGVSSFSPWAVTESSAPLPVEFDSISATVVENKHVKISWSTATETNNNYFVVERTRDGEYFEEVELVPGAGTSTERNSYSVTDIRPVKGVSYYHIKQVDLDGATVYSDLQKVEIIDVDEWDIYPNPYVRGELNLVLTELDVDKQAYVVLRDVQGQIVSEKEIDSISFTLVDITPSTPLAPGMYIVSVAVGQARKNIKLVIR